MNVKIQGSGNGTYANTGSCVAVTNYLQHEDLERMKKGEEVQPFFNQFRDYVSAREVTFKIDNNKAKLSRTDAKFYVITVSPSEKELPLASPFAYRHIYFGNTLRPNLPKDFSSGYLVVSLGNNLSYSLGHTKSKRRKTNNKQRKRNQSQRSKDKEQRPRQYIKRRNYSKSTHHKKPKRIVRR